MTVFLNGKDWARGVNLSIDLIMAVIGVGKRSLSWLLASFSILDFRVL